MQCSPQKQIQAIQSAHGALEQGDAEWAEATCNLHRLALDRSQRRSHRLGAPADPCQQLEVTHVGVHGRAPPSLRVSRRPHHLISRRLLPFALRLVLAVGQRPSAAPGSLIVQWTKSAPRLPVARSCAAADFVNPLAASARGSSLRRLARRLRQGRRARRSDSATSAASNATKGLEPSRTLSGVQGEASSGFCSLARSQVDMQATFKRAQVPPLPRTKLLRPSQEGGRAPLHLLSPRFAVRPAMPALQRARPRLSLNLAAPQLQRTPHLHPPPCHRRRGRLSLRAGRPAPLRPPLPPLAPRRATPAPSRPHPPLRPAPVAPPPQRAVRLQPLLLPFRASCEPFPQRTP